ncbi:MAG: hypothetical protein AB7O59_20040 [Pirellulales bacterium]
MSRYIDARRAAAENQHLIVIFARCAGHGLILLGFRGHVVIAMDFVESVLDEQGHDLGVRLDEFRNVRIVRGFRHSYALRGLLVDKLDFAGVAEHFCEQRIAAMDRLLLFDALLHGSDVPLNRSRDFRPIGFGERHDAVLNVLDLSANLTTMLQQLVKEFEIRGERGIATLAQRPSSATLLGWGGRGNEQRCSQR